MSGIVAIVLGVVAIAVCIAVTIKWYRKYQKQKMEEAKKLADFYKTNNDQVNPKL